MWVPESLYTDFQSQQCCDWEAVPKGPAMFAVDGRHDYCIAAHELMQIWPACQHWRSCVPEEFRTEKKKQFSKLQGSHTFIKTFKRPICCSLRALKHHWSRQIETRNRSITFPWPPLHGISWTGYCCINCYFWFVSIGIRSICEIHKTANRDSRQPAKPRNIPANLNLSERIGIFLSSDQRDVSIWITPKHLSGVSLTATVESCGWDLPSPQMAASVKPAGTGTPGDAPHPKHTL